MAESPFFRPGQADGPLDAEELRKIDAYWRASLYLCVGMIFLQDNPLLKEPLKMSTLRSASWALGIGPRSGFHLGAP